MTPLALAVVAFAGLALAFVGFALYRLQARGSDADPRLAPLQAERDRLAGELAQALERARADAEELGGLRATAAAHLRAQDEHARLQAQLEALRATLEDERVARASVAAELEDRSVQLEAVRSRVVQLDAELATLRAEHAQATAHLEHSRRQNDEMRAFVEQAQVKLSDAFAAMAGKVFAERGEQFEKNVRHATVQSKADIETLLKPFAEQLNQFRQRVDTVYGEEARERATLVGAVNELRTLNQDMAAQAAALTRALKGNAKVRGDWGELMLENVLRGSGLEEGQHYDRQKSGSDDEGRVLRPDVVVRLPGERCVVVDSKVNLVAWEEAMNAETPDAQTDAMRRHAVGLRQHVRDLADRNYPKMMGETALEVTIAFVPIEGALSAALGFDASLQSEAFEKGVVFASPNTLMAVLRVVERLWTRDRIQKQAREIGEAGGLLLDALTGFLAEFDRVGNRLDDAHKAYSDARNRLSESRQAVIPRARRLVALGARGKRKLAEDLVPDVEEFPALLGSEATPLLTEN
ncbi:DNA recombination protein RmuC [Lysobacter humi (ex Lee et al. 2017)]